MYQRLEDANPQTLDQSIYSKRLVDMMRFDLLIICSCDHLKTLQLSRVNRWKHLQKVLKDAKL